MQKQELLEKMQKQLKNFGGSEDQKRSEAEDFQEREVKSRAGAGSTVKFPKELPKYKREANLDLFFEETEAVLGSVRIDQRYCNWTGALAVVTEGRDRVCVQHAQATWFGKHRAHAV